MINENVQRVKEEFWKIPSIVGINDDMKKYAGKYLTLTKPYSSDRLNFYVKENRWIWSMDWFDIDDIKEIDDDEFLQLFQ